jgi:hypothetical protein
MFILISITCYLGFLDVPPIYRRIKGSDTILKGDLPRTIPAKFGLIWFSDFREEDLNVICYQNMPNLHNLYKSAERNIPQKNPEK